MGQRRVERIVEPCGGIFIDLEEVVAVQTKPEYEHYEIMLKNTRMVILPVNKDACRSMSLRDRSTYNHRMDMEQLIQSWKAYVNSK